MATPIHDRPYLAFLSHSHADKSIVDLLDDWLHRVAGIPVWYDSRDLNAASMIASDLPRALEQSRGAIIVVSHSSVSSGWVREEYNVAIQQRAENRNFKIIPIRIDDAEAPSELATTKWLDCPGGRLDLHAARQLILSLYETDFSSPPEHSRDVYFAAGWRDREAGLNESICRPFVERGFRLIGDSKDQRGFAFGDRVKSIMESCGAMLAILPHRGGGITSKYIIRELAIAQSLNIPIVAFAESGIDLEASFAEARDEFASLVEQIELIIPNLVRSLPAKSIDSESSVRDAVDEMSEEWRRPSKPHYIFLSRDFSNDSREVHSLARDVISGVTAMRCIDGDSIHDQNIQETIRDRIRGAFLVIADISEDNLNTSIEAGMSFGARVPTHLISKGPRRKPPFMFRDEQIWHYDNEVEMLGTIHRIVRPYRRRIVNHELP